MITINKVEAINPKLYGDLPKGSTFEYHSEYYIKSYVLDGEGLRPVAIRLDTGECYSIGPTVQVKLVDIKAEVSFVR